MFDGPLRAYKDPIFAPLARQLPPYISPNHITSLAFISGVTCCFAASQGQIWASVLLWALNRSLDCLDGALARQRGSTSELGGFLDLLGDFIVYSLIPISVLIGRESASDWQAVAILEASFHINNFVLFYVAAVAGKINTQTRSEARRNRALTSIAMKPALIEGFESGVLFTAMLIWPGWTCWISWVMSFAVGFGIAQRVIWVIPVLDELDNGGESKIE
ncbi:MAG: hypothetical protein M1827_002727 [Pycnora praestabilis]|nr:MAG: hypothetical protein M1827_002727 [Pycnora praestabilis]